ncbi:hypothetical protein ABZ372_51415, partial [Streptomyces sp. NPDC005921]
ALEKVLAARRVGTLYFGLLGVALALLRTSMRTFICTFMRIELILPTGRSIFQRRTPHHGPKRSHA